MSETTNLEALLKNGETVVYPATGFSMCPMIRQKRDLMILEPAHLTELRRYDCILFHCEAGYVMHRIVRFTEDGFLTRGDNRRTPERVPAGQVIGVLTGLRRDGRLISKKTVRRFGAVWSLLFPVRWCRMLLRDELRARKRRRKQ